MKAFNRSMLTFARELKGLTKVELATRLNCTPSAVSQFESGGIEMPDDDKIEAMVQVLGVRRSLLLSDNRFEPFNLENCHFRSLRSTAVRDRRQATHQGKLVAAVMAELTELGVEFPEERIHNYDGPTEPTEPIDELTNRIRRHWGVGLGPIGNLLGLMESNGVAILPLAEDVSDKVNAFSVWEGTIPFVFLDFGVPSTQLRFDAAHELGHLFIHHDVKPGDLQTEKEADQFARSFLMPSETFGAECPRRWDLERFIELNQRWRVPVPSMIHRGRQLGILSEYAATNGYKQLSSLGYARRGDGDFGEPMKEKPVALEQALSLVPHLTSLEDLSDAVGFSEEVVSSQLLQIVDPAVLARLKRDEPVYTRPVLRVIK